MGLEVPRVRGHSRPHRHFCEFGDHEWVCSLPDPRDYGTWTPPVCVCPTHRAPMDKGDHSECPIGILACRAHHLEQIKQMVGEGTRDLVEALSREMTPSERLKSEQKERFTQEVIFAYLKNLNTGFDSLSIPHVSPQDFESVIDRCEFLGVGINGIKVFSTVTWPSEHFVSYLGTYFARDQCYKGARQVVATYLEMADLSVCATFILPIAVLKSRGYCLYEENRK